MSRASNSTLSARIFRALARSLAEQGEHKLARQARASARMLSASDKVRQHQGRLSETLEHVGYGQTSISELLAETEALSRGDKLA